MKQPNCYQKALLVFLLIFTFRNLNAGTTKGVAVAPPFDPAIPTLMSDDEWVKYEYTSDAAPYFESSIGQAFVGARCSVEEKITRKKKNVTDPIVTAVRNFQSVKKNLRIYCGPPTIPDEVTIASCNDPGVCDPLYQPPGSSWMTPTGQIDEITGPTVYTIPGGSVTVGHHYAASQYYHTIPLGGGVDCHIIDAFSGWGNYYALTVTLRPTGPTTSSAPFLPSGAGASVPDRTDVKASLLDTGFN